MNENIQHFTGARLRVTGSGNLNMSFRSLDDVDQYAFQPLIMSSTPGREPFQLANFTGQRVRFQIGTTVLDEVFRISRMVIFVKPLWSDYPG